MTDAPKPNRSLYGRIGFALVMVSLLYMCASLLRYPDQDENPHRFINCLDPFVVLAALTASILGCVRDARKSWAIAGLALCGLYFLYAIGSVVHFTRMIDAARSGV